MRGVNDPDIVVKRPAESPGGMTVTIFKVRIMDGVKIFGSWRILLLASQSIACFVKIVSTNLSKVCEAFLFFFQGV